MDDKVMLTLADLRVLASTAERNGTQRNFPEVALQWAAAAQAEIERLRAELAQSESDARENSALADRAVRAAAAMEARLSYEDLVAVRAALRPNAKLTALAEAQRKDDER